MSHNLATFDAHGRETTGTRCCPPPSLCMCPHLCMVLLMNGPDSLLDWLDVVLVVVT